MYEIIKKKLHIIHNIYIKHKYFVPKKTYSMDGEDLIIFDYFKNKKEGFFIDVGCYHPYNGNNTKLLYDRGWSGINIDLDFQITDNNTITILPKTNVIKVTGNVYNPGFIAHQSGKGMSLTNAVELAGGYKPNSIKKASYVVRANGEIEQVNIFNGRAKRIFPGDAIFVPVDPNPNEFDITSFVADLSSTLANIAAILVIADNN